MNWCRWRAPRRKRVAARASAAETQGTFAMKKKFPVSTLLMLAAAFRVAAAPANTPPGWHESFYDRVLGTSLELKFEAGSSADAAAAEAATLAEIDRLAGILSGYDA